MFDPIAQGLRAVSSGSANAFPLVFAAGALSSVGPCVAPRFIAVASLVANQKRKRALVVACSFVTGLIAVYASFGAAASLLGRATQISSWVYAGVALVLGVSGVLSLWKDESPCDHEQADTRLRNPGAAFFLGASFALVISPCCTPVVVGILTYTSSAGDPVYGSTLLACFALGHALPIFAVAAGAGSVGSTLARYFVREAANVLSSSLMLALAAYYAVLA